MLFLLLIVHVLLFSIAHAWTTNSGTLYWTREPIHLMKQDSSLEYSQMNIHQYVFLILSSFDIFVLLEYGCVMASKNLIKAYPYLQVLQQRHSNTEVRRALLKEKCVLQALREICFNILQGNLDIPKSCKEELLKYSKDLLKIVDKEEGLGVVYDTLSNQRGGSLLGIVLAVALPLIEALWPH